MLKFAESGHPVFRATSPLSRGTLTIIMNNLLKAPSQHATQSGIDNQAWSSHQVRKRHKRSSINVKENDEKHSVIWEYSCL